MRWNMSSSKALGPVIVDETYFFQRLEVCQNLTLVANYISKCYYETITL